MAKPPQAAALDLGKAGGLGALAHYAEPAYYSKTYAWRKRDVAYYEGLAKRLSGPVLEYGVGNGRIALPIARQGIAVHGVDLSGPMLADFRQQLGAEPKEVQQRVRLRRGDMRSVNLRRKFPLVIAPFNTVLHLYSRRDIERFFARVQQHLEPGGRFVFDWSIPQADDLCRDPNRRYGAPRLRHPTTGEVVKYAERFDYDPYQQLLCIWTEFSPVKSKEPPWTIPLSQRQFFPREMEALLHYNGFSKIRFFADFTNRTPDFAVDSIVASCSFQPPRKAARRPLKG